MITRHDESPRRNSSIRSNQALLLSHIFNSILGLFPSILNTASESILLMIMEFPAFDRRIVAQPVPLYNPNMSRGTFSAADTGFARPMFRVSPKVCL
jgi:hypothetical protein